MGFKEERKTLLHKKNDSLTGDIVRKEILQCHDGPECGVSIAAPEKQSQTGWSLT